MTTATHEFEVGKPFDHTMVRDALDQGYIVGYEEWDEGEYLQKDEDGNYVDEDGSGFNIDHLPVTQKYSLIESEEEVDIESTDEESTTSGFMDADAALDFMGAKPKKRGDSKVTDDQIYVWENLSSLGYSFKQISEKFNVHANTVSKKIKEYRLKTQQ